MVASDVGLTDTYNRVDDPTDLSGEIQTLRALHVALDEAVADAYGWSDMALDHGHYETPVGRRFTISPTAQTDLLARLLALNHERHAREAANGQGVGQTGRRRRRHNGDVQLGLVTEGDA
jgi:hypothetical protein